MPQAQNLTRTRCEAASCPADRQYTTFPDTTPPGFHLRVYGRNQRKVFYLRYRNEAGRDRLHKIGEYPTWHPEQARERARELRVKVDKGTDPQAERQAKRSAESPTTVGDLLRAWYAEKSTTTRKGSAEDDARRIGKMVAAFGDVPLDQFEPDHLRRLFDATVAEGHETEAVRIAQVFRTAWKWTAERDAMKPHSADVLPAHIRVNPGRLILDTSTVKKDRRRERIITPDELAIMVAAADDLADEYEGYRGGVYADAYHRFRILLRLELLTGLRKSEIRDLRASNVNRRAKSVRLDTFKTTKANRGKEFLVQYLCDDALRLIALLDDGEADPLFPSPADPSEPRDNFKRQWTRVRDTAHERGVLSGDEHEEGPIVFHGLRHFVMTTLTAKLMCPEALADYCLNRAVRHRYIDPEPADALDAFERLAKYLRGEHRRNDVDVLQLGAVLP